LVAEADAEYDEAEADRAKAESELDANEHHVADMRTAIERLNDELERVRHELKQAQGQMPGLERRLKIATRAAEKAARRRDSRRQHLGDDAQCPKDLGRRALQQLAQVDVRLWGLVGGSQVGAGDPR
jgi:chromosome segregation ATPase